MYTVGLEEEFFVFDAKTRRTVRRLNKKFLKRATDRLGDRVMTEMLQSQIEVATPPCETMQQARDHLAHYRTELAEAGAAEGIGVAACGTFPLAFLAEQTVTPKERYGKILDELQMIGRRNMFCGMHVHVAVPDISTRINLMMRLTPYLPLLLALSTSSPIWQGNPTGLSGYRLAAYSELPRTGLPELFRTNEDYNEYVSSLVSAKIIADGSYIWWALRPSLANPTLELRINDCCTRLDDAVAIASLYRCLVARLDRDRELNAGFDRVARGISEENKWRAQRYGIAATFIEPMRREGLTATQWLDEVLELVSGEAPRLDCERELSHLKTIAAHGTSADRQMDIYNKARSAGRQRLTALKDVVDWLGEETRSVRGSL